MTEEQERPPDFLFEPPRVWKHTLSALRKQQDAGPGLTFGIEALDDRINPLRPGELVSVIARPGMGKTMLMVYLTKRWSRQLADGGGRGVVVYATWETLVEEFCALMTAEDTGKSLEQLGRGDFDLGRVKDEGGSVVLRNFYAFGRSKEEIHRGAPQPRAADLVAGLERIIEGGFEPRVLVVDYLQRIPLPANTRSFDRTAGVAENLEFLKDLALRYNLCVVLGVQASREVDKYGEPRFPTMNDAQWTSAVEQTSDKVLSLTIPAKYNKKGEYPENALLVRLLKQRFGVAAYEDAWQLEFDFAGVRVLGAAPLLGADAGGVYGNE